MKESSLNEKLNVALQTLDFERGETRNGMPTELIRYLTARDHDCGGGRGAALSARRKLRLSFDVARICGHQPAGLALKMVEGDPLDNESLHAHYRRLFGSAEDLAPILTNSFIKAFKSETATRADISRGLATVRNQIETKWVFIGGMAEDMNKAIRKATLDALRRAQNAPANAGRHIKWLQIQNSPDTETWTSIRRDKAA